ncbi:MAG: RNA-binding protein [Thermoanaerobaculia bacterium]|jgi:RNA-binding protein|nr:RNA-binding protein [Thermoanaerobaculia bacterium]
MALTSKQRQFLKGLAHALVPVVRIGRAGATPSVIEETKRSLFAHELIKVRIDSDDSAQRLALAEELARASEAELAGTIGKLAILYRPRDEEPEIELPA